MITEKGIMKNLKNLIGEKFDNISEIYNEIVCAFEDFEFKGESFVQVDSKVNYNNIIFTAYIDHIEAEEFFIVAEKEIQTTGEYDYTIVNAF